MSDAAFPIIYTADLPRSVAFYRDQFGFEVTYRWPDAGPRQFVVLKRGESEVGLSTLVAAAETMAVDLDPGSIPSFELCLYVDDVDAKWDTLRTRGVTTRGGPTDRPWGERSAYVEDPDGNPLQIVAPRD